MSILPPLLFGISASLDALLVGMALGLQKVPLPARHNLLISTVTLIGTVISIGLGNLLLPLFPRRLPKARNPKEQKKVDTDAGRKGSPVILAEKPMPILFMERAQPSASICDRDNSRCPTNFFFFWHRLLSGEKLQRHLESSHFPT